MKGKNKNRKCFGCNSEHSSYSKRDQCEVWFLNWDEEGNVLCRNCFRRYIQPDQTFKRRIKQDGKITLVKEPPRSGYCQLCSNNIYDGSCNRTALFRGIQELCLSCFNKVKWDEGIIKPKKTAPRGPRTNTTEKTRKKLSIAMKGRIFSDKHREAIKKARARQVIPVVDTILEKRIQIELDKLRINYKKHKMFNLEGLLHSVDIFIPPNVCVECDGEYWHIRLIGRGSVPPLYKDFLIDSKLEKMNLKVIRLQESDIMNNLEWCVKQIRDAMYK